MTVIEIPYTPRPLQLEAHNRAERFALLICHRRFGKTVFAVNEMLRIAAICKLERPRVAYIAPLFRQAKSVAWDMVKHYSRVIPEVKYNESELRCDLPNGARVSLYGADSPDTLRGHYWDLCVIDEAASMGERLIPEIIRPALADRKGKMVVISTPRGHDALYRLYQQVKHDEDWYVRIHSAEDTGYVDGDELQAARKAMSENQFNQEFLCSFSAAIEGAYYANLIDAAEQGGRIGKVEHDPGLTVETWWDLGIGDPCAIFFAQRNGPEIRIIDYYEATGEPLSHYVHVLEQKAKEGEWVYDAHVFPHDVRQRSLDTGRSRVETLRELGVEPDIVVMHRVEDGIEAVRRMLPNCWFDELRVGRGLDALRQFRSQYIDKTGTFKLRPLHSWASPAADAFRYGAMHVPTAHTWEPIEYDNTGIV